MRTIMKILKFGCLILAVIFLITGCGNIKNILSDVKEQVFNTSEETSGKKYRGPHDYAVDVFNEVLEFVKAKDSQAIFDLFCEYDRENEELMPDIEKLVNFMDGEIVEMRQVGASSDHGIVQDGVTVSASYSASTFVTTETGSVYWFRVGVVTSANDETKLGLDWIYILDCHAKTAYTTEWGNWNERRINGAKEPEPVRPDNIEVGVNYF